MKSIDRYVSVFIITFCLVPWAQTFKILAIYPLPCRSTFMFHTKTMKILLDLGHELTVISKFPQHGRIVNYTDIDVANDIENFCDGVIQADSYGSNVLFDLLSYQRLQINQLKRLYVNENIKNLLNSNQTFDLVIVEMDFFFDHYLPMAFAFNAPVIGVFTNLVPLPDTDVSIGNVVNPSWLPSPLGGFSFKMNLMQRMRNCYYYVLHFVVRIYVDYVVNPIIKESLPNSPLASELHNNISLVFDNSHPTLLSRPMPPYVISLAGLHISAASPLPEDVEKFISDAENGVIYVSLGSTVRFSSLPVAQQEVFLRVFSNLPYRVVWKHDKPELVNSSSSNILVKSWFPQSDILADRRVKLFISHCGLFGLYEAINYGVPVLGMPVFMDQSMNCLLMEESQLGISLDYRKIDENLLRNAIQTVLTTDRYSENMKIASGKFNDKPRSPAETLAFWTEYVVRHKGPPHSNVVGRHLSLYEYLLLDVIAIIFASLSIVYLIFRKLVTKLLRRAKRRDKTD